jgi:hypothetical protein
MDINGGPIVPLEPEEAVEQLCLPKHKQAREKDPPLFDSQLVMAKLFPNLEAYSKPAESRPIIDCDHQYKHSYTCITGALAKVLKRTDWYAFGKGPEELVERVVAMSVGCESIAETDYSRFDTTIGGVRPLEEEMIRTMFSDKEANRLWALQLDAKVRIGNFTNVWYRYTSQMERLSGSPETSVLNSIDNALISYIGLRKIYGEQEAWLHLGLYGGDDGIQPAEAIKEIEAVAKECGLTLKLMVRLKGEPFSFLGRYYNSWAGEPWSCYDPVRFLAKLQYTTDNTVPKMVALGRKLSSLAYTDLRTPWVADVINKYTQLVGPLPTLEEFDPEVNYYAWLSYHTKQVFPTPLAEECPMSWMLDLYDSLLSEEDKAKLDKLAVPLILNDVVQHDPEVRIDSFEDIPPPLPKRPVNLTESAVLVARPAAPSLSQQPSGGSNLTTPISSTINSTSSGSTTKIHPGRKRRWRSRQGSST